MIYRKTKKQNKVFSCQIGIQVSEVQKCMSDNQKRYLIKKVNINQILLRFRKRTAYQFLNSGNSPPAGIRNSLTLNIAYAKTLCTALSDLYSGKMDRILLGLKPEFVVYCL